MFASSTPSTPVARRFSGRMRGKPVVVLSNKMAALLPGVLKPNCWYKDGNPGSSSKRRSFLVVRFFQQLRALREPE